MTAEELGAAIGTHKVTVSKWENGRQEAGSRWLPLIARALGVTTDYLLGLTDEERPVEPSEAQIKLGLIRAILETPITGPGKGDRQQFFEAVEHAFPQQQPQPRRGRRAGGGGGS